MNESATNNTNHYWTRFWHQHSEATLGKPDQNRVLRTLNKTPIDAERWQATAGYVLDHLNLHHDHDVLDLAGGNGLFAKEIQPRVNSVTVVDVAESLLPKSSESVNTICSDMRQVAFAEHSFDRILLYAAVQYLTQAETVRLMQKLHLWLKPNGILFIGDVPDVDKRWDFFDSDSRQQAYFQNLAAGQPTVGTWFSQDWFEQLGRHAGFRKTSAINQPDDQIFAWFRFDFRGEK